MTDEQKDDAWREKVKRIHGEKCPHCGLEGSAHHIMPRGCRGTRWIVENGYYACHKLHRTFEGDNGQKRKEDAIKIYIGLELYQNLEKIKRGTATAEAFDYEIVE